MRRLVALSAVAFAVAGCGALGDARRGAPQAKASLDGVSLAIEGAQNVKIEPRRRQAAGPPEGWSPTLAVEFLVDAAIETVENPARLTFTIDADLLAGERDPDELNVFYDALAVTAECKAEGEARPDPCIEWRAFEENGDATIVVLASDPSTS